MTATNTLARIEAVLAAATAGPWVVDLDIFDSDDLTISVCVSDPAIKTLWTSETDINGPAGPDDPKWQAARSSPQMADATFIAFARNTYPEALAVIRAAAAHHEAASTGHLPWDKHTALGDALAAFLAKAQEYVPE